MPSAFASFAKSTSGLIDADSYQTVSDARADAKEFATSSQINQIDLIDFAEKLGTAEAQAFADVLRGCIKYNRTTTNITNANGVSIFFPYEQALAARTRCSRPTTQIGIASEYSECITQLRQRGGRRTGHLERQRELPRRPARRALRRHADNGSSGSSGSLRGRGLGGPAEAVPVERRSRQHHGPDRRRDRLARRRSHAVLAGLLRREPL